MSELTDLYDAKVEAALDILKANPRMVQWNKIAMMGSDETFGSRPEQAFFVDVAKIIDAPPNHPLSIAIALAALAQAIDLDLYYETKASAYLSVYQPASSPGG